MKAVTIADSSYPANLLRTPDPPAVLFYTGSMDVFTGCVSVAVIGSRRCSLYGRKTARSLSAGLSAAGACVVSGLARGIDAEAHRGALQVKGRTAAVLGGGLDCIYPPEHTGLAQEISRTGCLLTEYPPGVKPARFTFPERNRIISGLSTAVVVVEAGERSGTMITVGTALDQGRDVYAVPGELGRSTSTGTNRLIRDGAGIVLSADELLSDLGMGESRVQANSADPIIAVLQQQNLSVEQLSVLLDLNRTELTERLLRLELTGSVMRRPGNTFTAIL